MHQEKLLNIINFFLNVKILVGEKKIMAFYFRNGSSQLENLLIRGVILNLDDMSQNTDILGNTSSSAQFCP